MNKRVEIEQLIAQAQEAAIKTEESERAAGKILEDNPVARLLLPVNALVPVGMQGTFKFAQLVSDPLHARMVLGATSYLTSRRMWKAYPAAVKIAGGDNGLLYELFHVVAGTASVVERDDQMLLGVRSASLAGTHAGMVSVPAGLMEVDEGIDSATRRELREETSITEVESLATAAANNPDAPNVTFVTRMRTCQAEVSETFEAKGKKFFWMPRDSMLEAASGSTSWLAREFQKKGMNLDSCKIAPDIRSGIKQLYNL